MASTCLSDAAQRRLSVSLALGGIPFAGTAEHGEIPALASEWFLETVEPLDKEPH